MRVKATKHSVGRWVARILLTILIVMILSGAAVIWRWYPVIDRLMNWCKYYPQSLGDCSEVIRKGSQ